MNQKYPRTPYWPYSPAVGREDEVHPDPARFVGAPVVITEKLDGSNTLIHAGKVYTRGGSAPCRGKWMAMVKKHHAWKVRDPEIYLYGEDIYGVHSIAYGAVQEDRTFYAFALQHQAGVFASFAEVEAYVDRRGIPLIPVLFRGRFRTVAEIRAFLKHAHREPSVLGGEREGIVLRLAHEFSALEFQSNVCKSVRVGHVQSDEHWTKNWKPCKLAN
jgi:hypothetical protein